MTPDWYAILAYAVGLGLMAAYALGMFVVHQSLARREDQADRAASCTQTNPETDGCNP